MIMSNYVGIVRSDLRLERAMVRLEIIYKETESLYKTIAYFKKNLRIEKSYKCRIYYNKNGKEQAGEHWTALFN